jgi:aminoglycoside 6'-N-acetyltransferase
MDPMALPWDFHPIDGARVRLDLLREDDLDALYELQSDPEVCRYLLFEPRSRDEVAAVIERDAPKARLEKVDDYIQPAIRGRHSEGALMGTMYLNLSSVDDRTAEIGWLVGPRFQGQGYARECAALLLDLAFGELGLHRVYAELDPRNAASVGVCKSLGMRHEANFVEHMWLKGEWTDTGHYAILEREWRGAPTLA